MNQIIPVDKLKTTTLGDLTQSQLNATSALTFIPQRAALEDLILIWNAKRAVSTSGGSGIIPSKGDVQETTITDIPLPAASVLRPAAGEVWRVDIGMLTVTNGSAALPAMITMQIEDSNGGSSYNIPGSVPPSEAGQPFPGTRPYWLTDSLFIRITSDVADTSQVTIPVQYEAM